MIFYENSSINESASSINNNHKQKGHKSLKEFNKLDLNEYASLYSSNKMIKHLRINNSTKGYLFIDKTNYLVAVINVETKQDNTKWIQGLEISNNYQGYGLSNQLLDVAVNELGANYLSVNKNNNVAKSIYEKYGFDIYKDTGNMYFMKLKNKNSSINESAEINEDSKLYKKFKDIVHTSKWCKMDCWEFACVNEFKEPKYLDDNSFIFALFTGSEDDYKKVKDTLETNHHCDIDYIDHDDKVYLKAALRENDGYFMKGATPKFDQQPQSKQESFNDLKEYLNAINEDCLVSETVINKDSEDRENVLLMVEKILKDNRFKVSIDKKDRQAFISYDDTGFKDSSLCISIGTDNLAKACALVNKEINPYGGKLSADNYGTAFLNVYETVDMTSEQVFSGDWFEQFMNEEPIQEVDLSAIKEKIQDAKELKKEWTQIAKNFVKHRWIFRYINEKQREMLDKYYKMLTDDDTSYSDYKKGFNFICKFMGLNPKQVIIEHLVFKHDDKDKNQPIVALNYSKGLARVKLPKHIRLVHVSPAHDIKELIPSFRSKVKGKYMYPTKRIFFTIKSDIDQKKNGTAGMKTTRYTPIDNIEYAYIDPTYADYGSGFVYVETDKNIPVQKWDRFMDKLRNKKDEILHKTKNESTDLEDDEFINESLLSKFLDNNKKWVTSNQSHSKQTFKSDIITDDEYEMLNDLIDILIDEEDYKEYKKAFDKFCRFCHIVPTGTIITKYTLKKGLEDHNSLHVEYSANTKQIEIPSDLALYHMSSEPDIKELQPFFRGKGQSKNATGFLYDKPRIYFTINEKMPKFLADYKSSSSLHKYKAKKSITKAYVDPLVWAHFQGAVYVSTTKPIAVEEVKDKPKKDNKKFIEDLTDKDVNKSKDSEMTDRTKKRISHSMKSQGRDSDNSLNKASKVNESNTEYDDKFELFQTDNNVRLASSDINDNLNMTVQELLDNTDPKHIYLSSDWHIFKNRYKKEANYVNTSKIISWCKKHIKPTDIFMYLGDMSYRWIGDEDREEVKKIFKSLPGIKILIIGNHDEFSDGGNYEDYGFKYAMHELRWRDLLFTHKPVNIESDDNITYNIHGHIHYGTEYNTTDGSKNINDYPTLYGGKPTTLDYILNHAEKLIKDNKRSNWINMGESSKFGELDLDLDNISWWYVCSIRTPSDIDEELYYKNLQDAIKAYVKPGIFKDKDYIYQYVYTCNGDKDCDGALKLLPMGKIVVYPSYDYKWVEKYPLTIDDDGKLTQVINEEYLLQEASDMINDIINNDNSSVEEWAMNACNPIAGIKQPYYMAVIDNRGTKTNKKKYAVSNDIVPEKYAIVNEKNKIEVVDKSYFDDESYIEMYKYIGNNFNIKKLEEAYSNNDIVDQSFLYSVLSGKELLSEDQIEFDDNFSKVDYDLIKESKESKIATLKEQCKSLLGESLYNLPVLEHTISNNNSLKSKLSKYKDIELREDTNGYYFKNTITNNRTRSVKDIYNLSEAMIKSIY